MISLLIMQSLHSSGTLGIHYMQALQCSFFGLYEEKRIIVCLHCSELIYPPWSDTLLLRLSKTNKLKPPKIIKSI